MSELRSLYKAGLYGFIFLYSCTLWLASPKEGYGFVTQEPYDHEHTLTNKHAPLLSSKHHDPTLQAFPITTPVFANTKHVNMNTD